MAQPDRPFVPHRTPKRTPPVASASEFRLARPFVAGAEPEPVMHPEAVMHEEAVLRKMVETAQPERARIAPVESAPSFRSIDDFLHSSAPDPVPIAQESVSDEYASGFDEGSELPPVEHFLDPLPQIAEFASDDSNPFDEAPSRGDEDFAASEPPSGSLAAEWANTDWQQYDWRSLAALGEGGETAASNDWATTDWDATGPRTERTPKDVRPTAAQAIASALDQIAQRIRAGELAVPNAGGSTDAATLAATLASILGIRT